MSRSKAKGTAAETAVVRYLREAGFIQAERRTLSGVQDRGDIAGIPGVVIEVKNCARQELPAWVGEAERERDNDRASLGVVWHKRRGTTDPGAWFVTMSGEQFAALLRAEQGLPATTCSAQYHGDEDGARLCIRAAQHTGRGHTDEHGFHWSDTVAVYPLADGTFRTGVNLRAQLRRMVSEAQQGGVA